jgi:hypothetical protein
MYQNNIEIYCFATNLEGGGGEKVLRGLEK